MTKALVKQITFGVFDDGMRFTAQIDYSDPPGIIISSIATTESLPLDANPSQVSQAIIDAAVARAVELELSVVSADVYALDLVRGV